MARPLTTALRHLLAGAVTVAASLLLWTIIYLALLAWALATDSGLGGPLAYPFGLIMVSFCIVPASLLLFCPATLLSEALCRRQQLPSILAGIPLTCVFAAVAIGLADLLATVLAGSSPLREFGGPLPTFAFLLIPLGIYWWTSQFPTFITRLYHKLRRKAPPAGKPSNRSPIIDP